MRDLSCSLPYLRVQIAENDQNIALDQPTIVFNTNTPSITIGTEEVKQRMSSIFTGSSIDHSTQGILIQSEYGFSGNELHHPQRNDIMNSWQHVHDIFPLPHLEKTALWRSPKERIGNVAYNLWFASDQTDCGLHNTHDFLEVHTQVWGTGHMQKFHENDPSTMYQDIFMTPGFTHEPFCKEDLLYPWHRYKADTDCIWLAIEYYKE